MLPLLLACAPPLDVPLPSLVVDTEVVTVAAAVGDVATAEVVVRNASAPSAEAAPYAPALALGESAANPGIATVGDDFCAHWPTPACAVVVEAASGAGTTCPDGAPEGGDALALPPGCELPVTVVWAPSAAGEALGALRVGAAFGPWSPVDAPEVWEWSSDPVEPVREVGLVGTGTVTAPAALVLDPPLGEAAWRWPDGTSQDLSFTLTNTGGVDARLDEPDLGCSVAWSLVDAPAHGDVLAAGEARRFTVRHTPTDPDPEVCTLSFPGTDGEASTGAVLRFASTTWSQPPSVTITSPAPGEVVPDDETVTLRFEIADDEAPPTGIFLTIWSAAQKRTLAQGLAPDDSGVVEFDLPVGELVAGAETLRVSGLDWQFFTSFDAVAFRVGAAAEGDADGDSWTVADGDCDDADPAAFPGAIELGNGVDDDCDTSVDDGVAAADNDGDGFTEAQGDCNDHEPSIAPDAAETANNVDDDCDQVVDEGTQRYDDDGDGYSELVDDCDDADADVHPAATDTCDADRDCDGAIDPCDAAPVVVWASVSPDVCHPGDTVELGATAPGGAALLWVADRGTVVEPGAAATSFVCPDSAGSVLLSVSATGGDTVATDLVRVEVVDDGDSLDDTVPLGGCAGAVGLGLGCLGAAGWSVGRRRATGRTRAGAGRRRGAWLALLVGSGGCASGDVLPAGSGDSATVDTAPDTGDGAGACPRDMVVVADGLCIDAYEATLEEEVGGRWVPFSPYDTVAGRTVRASVGAGRVPQGYVSGDEAAAACEAAGKRLCTSDEWLAACRGPTGRTFPYGDTHVDGACNDVYAGGHPVCDYFGTCDGVFDAEHMNDPGINQQAGTVAAGGAYADCVSEAGAADLHGNLHEWVDDGDGTFRGGFYADAAINGEGCAYVTTAHDRAYHDYSTGFRCCVGG